MNNKTYICLQFEHVTDLSECLEKTQSNLYDAVVIPIVNPLFYREFDQEPIKSKHIAFSRSDLILKPNDWYHKVIACITNSIDCDSDDYQIRRHSENTLLQEISFAEHLVQQGYIMVQIKSGKCVNLARIISKAIRGTVIASLPISDPKVIKQNWRRDINEDEIDTGEDTWKWWNKFHMITDFNPKIKLGLEIFEDIPSKDQILRWLGEPVDYIILPSNIFIRNRNNYPVLSKAHQELVSQFLNNKVDFIIKSNFDDKSVKLYAEYMKHIVEKMKINDPMQGYDDVIQIPLQPLYDNLDSYTYEIFEKDPIKYKYYQNAIELALIDKVPESEISKKTIIVMILGAGRGPLVRAALNAAENTKRKIKVYIIEKNPNAVVTLVALVEELWSDKDIEIFSNDMRDFSPPTKADILVSELLGSFGDNELSPECLDGAQKHLKKDGISIPCKSTSYINPIMSSKIYNSVRLVYVDRFSNSPRTYSVLNPYDNTYVIYLKNIYNIARPQSLFEFYHPNKCRIIDNSRFKTLRFDVTQDCVLHGFGGYFDSTLYKDIEISIHPETHSKGLSSWFSSYFPIDKPLQLKAGDVIEVNFWRHVSSHKVWYEWNTTSPFVTRIHNHNGNSCAIYK